MENKKKAIVVSIMGRLVKRTASRHYWLYDGVKWVHIVEVVEPESCHTPLWLNDWWEGEKYIRLLGICGVNGLDICGGLYEED